MISVDEALRHIRDHAPIPELEQVPLREAAGRILAEDITAKIDMPAFASSSMDGYAIGPEGTECKLKLVGDSAAGHPFTGTIGAGEAVRISTGAALPVGADRVAIQENVTRDGDDITLRSHPNSGAWVRAQGSDFRRGDLLLKREARLTPADLTLAASGHHATLPVRRKFRVALLSNGDELCAIGNERAPGQIIAANHVGLAALLEKWGADVIDLGIVRDIAGEITAAISGAADADILVPIGGASVGQHDLMQPTFNAAGFKTVFSTIAMRPGKPCWMAIKSKPIVMGLPGNPASTLVCAHLFLRPLLGLENRFAAVPIDRAIEENGPRETYLRAVLSVKNGKLSVSPLPEQDSFRLRPQSEANALIKVPPMGGPYKAGDRLNVMPLTGGPALW